MTEDQDVRELLARRAASIRPSAAGRDAIAEKLARGRSTTRRPALLAAAAVLAVAMIGTALVVRGGDDTTSVETGRVAAAPPGGTATTPLLDAVWPTADEAALLASAPPAARQQYPWAAAQLYLEQRVGTTVPEDGFTLVSGDATNAVLRVTDGSVDAEIVMRRVGSTEDPVWYVVRVTSGALAVRQASYGGSHITAEVVAIEPGALRVEVAPADGSDPVIGLPERDVAAGDAIAIDERLPDEAGVVVRGALTLEDGTAALVDAMVPTAGATPATATDGVWPWPGDDVDETTLDDPVATARAYVAARVGELGATTVSEFQRGDSRSGEVVLTGDVATTVFLRQGDDDRWFVVGAASDLVTFHDAGDGTTTVRFETAGEVAHVEHLSSEPRRPPATTAVQAGEEWKGFGYTYGRDDLAVRHSFVFATADGIIALGELRFVSSP